MVKVLKILDELGVPCLAAEPVNLDHERFAEYRDSDEHPAEEPFENPGSIEPRKFLGDFAVELPTILRFFLDGSRKTYKIGDFIKDSRHYYPIVAGQVGVAVIMRDDNNRLLPLRQFCEIKNLIAFPDNVANDDIATIQKAIDTRHQTPFEVVKYTVRAERDPIDLGVARIMSEMHDLEIEVVQQMAEGQMLSTDRMLIIDGPLRFTKRFDLVQFKNVAGLSKTFKPSFTVGKGRRQESVGAITSRLNFGERTTVFKTTQEDKTIGMWYLRIRKPEMLSMPLEGVVKIESYAVDPAEKESGLDTERIDNISRFVLRERNATANRTDSRWASHIYPVYMAEKYIKSSFRSDTHFKALF